MNDFERQCIVRALGEYDGNITRAAKALRMNRQAPQRMMRRLGIRASGDRRNAGGKSVLVEEST